MPLPSPTKGGLGGQQQCPPPPPSSPAQSHRRSAGEGRFQHHQDHYPDQQQQQHQPRQRQVAGLLQFAQSSYETNPTEALSALMDALTLSAGTDAAAQHAMDRIRSELGDAVADCVVGNASSYRVNSMHQRNFQSSTPSATAVAADQQITLRAMEVVQQLINDSSTILYGQGRQHLLQQAMEDGSSVVCSRCGDMISRERWTQHVKYWCRGIEEEKGCNQGESMAMAMDD